MSDTMPLDEPLERPSLLLVDDDPTFCGVLDQALRKRGYEVHVATDVETGIRLAEEIEPEFAVIDLRIGQESGLALVKRLHELDANTRIVMLTGFASIATAVEAIKLGAVQYLTKPVEVDEILAALQGERPATAAVAAPATPRSLSVRRAEWEHIQRVLANHGGNISAAARALGIHRRTLQRKLRKRPVRS